MKALYVIYSIIVTFIVLFLTFVIGGTIGPGSNEIGYVIVALSIVCGIIVACTCSIVDTIKNQNRN